MREKIVLLGSCLGGNCPCWQVSSVAVVRCGAIVLDESCLRDNFPLRNCPQDNCLIRQRTQTLGQLPTRRIAPQSTNPLPAPDNIPPEQLPLGQLPSKQLAPPPAHPIEMNFANINFLHSYVHSST